MSPASSALAVGMVGHAFMGAAHSQAWRSAPRFFDLALTPSMTVVCGRDATRAAEAAAHLGWAESESDWRRVVARDDVDLVDICTPGDSHAEIAIAALEAGKHVLCEKPLANSVAEAEAMTEAAERAAARRSAGDGGFHLPPGPGRSRWPVASSPRAGSARSGTSARSTCRTGSPIRRRPCRGAWRRTRPAPEPSATSAPTSSTSPSSSPATGSPRSPDGWRRSSRSDRWPTEHSRALGHGRRGAGGGHRRRRRRVHRPLHRRGARRVRGDPVRHRPQERDPDRDQRLRAAAWRSTSRT